jgi:hypothetical protein
MQLMPQRPSPKCPKCDASVDEVNVVRYNQSFRCPNCHTEIVVPKLYLYLIFFVSAGVSAFLCLSLHLTGAALVLGFLVVLFPTMFSAGLVVRRFVPPRLAIYRDPNSLF